ncbi:hypothetical protein [Caballeronia humi]|nr:hypothetical protein [Caballeronia humi]
MVLHAERDAVHHADMRRFQQIVGEVEIGTMTSPEGVVAPIAPEQSTKA